MEIDWGLESVRAAAGQAEKWRWSVSEAIAARAQTLGLPQDQGPKRPMPRQAGASFDHITPGQVGDDSSWRLRAK
eukprot:1100594-Pyramimonas_sp.AAC.1